MGTNVSTDPRRAKRIILSNQISISIALLSLPYIVVYLATGAKAMGWLEIPIFLGYASVHRLNKAGLTRFSRLWLITLANLDILIYTLTLGKCLELQIYYLACGFAPLVLFDGMERKSIIYGIALSTLLLLGTEIFAPDVGLVFPLIGQEIRNLRVAQMATLYLVQLLMMVYFLNGNIRTEEELAKASKAARAADEAKSEFLADLSRDIRMPLGEISRLSDILIKSGLPPEAQATADDIRLSAHDLTVIVDEISDLSRIESGDFRIEKQTFSPLRLGQSVLRPFQFEAERKKLALSLDADPDMPGQLVGDSARIKQVLRNLLGNAFKFTDMGKVVLRIRKGPDSGGSTTPLVFEIEDTGIGIPEKARNRIFESFYQVDSGAGYSYDGTGLGLFISRQIVELMGGVIGYRPRPGGGSIFHFTLPLESRGLSPAKPETDFPMGSRLPYFDGELPTSTRDLRVLVVDDHPLNRKVLASFLAGYQLKADVAATADEALEACTSRFYHLIFMDCRMPGMDGFECTRRLRSGPSKAAAALIVGVSADVVENNLKKCLDAGMDSLLAKPIMERQLCGLIAACAQRIAKEPES